MGIILESFWVNFRKKKQKKHLFYIKIRQIDQNRRLPILTDLLKFLEIGLAHILKSIKHFYKKEDHNIAFMALHQSPMINALNSGT